MESGSGAQDHTHAVRPVADGLLITRVIHELATAIVEWLGWTARA